MAWQTFKMLIWPASTAMRGAADTTRALTDMNGPRVFETYKADWETFLAHATQPLDWNSYPSAASACANAPPLTPGMIVLASLNEFGNVTEPEFNGLSHVLVAQNGSLARYLAGYGQGVFGLIRQNQLYRTANVPAPGIGSPTPATATPNGAITIKSAWIEMTPTTPDPSKFYRRQAWLQDPVSGVCTKTEVGLIALHIVHKTVSSPQWIWASFEHVQNSPTRGIDPPKPYTFNDGSGTPMPSSPPGNTTIPLPGGIVPPPFNVERLQPIANDTATVNAAWRGLLGGAGSIWANYELVLVEWPGLPNNPARNGLQADPTPPCLADPQTNLANSVVETFIQPKISCTRPTTCMGCHGNARTSDFIWSLPLNKNGQEELNVLSEDRRAGLSILRRITGFGRDRRNRY